MTALYHGIPVRVVGYNASGTTARIVWRGMQKRVNARDLVTTPETAMPAGIVRSDDAAARADIAIPDERIPQ